MAKNFNVSEGIKVQFRADMFNSLNHVNLGGPNTNISSGQFRRITGAGGMRASQRALAH